MRRFPNVFPFRLAFFSPAFLLTGRPISGLRRTVQGVLFPHPVRPSPYVRHPALLGRLRAAQAQPRRSRFTHQARQLNDAEGNRIW